MIGSAQLHKALARRQRALATLVGAVTLVAGLGASRTAYAQAGAPYAFTKIQYPGSTYTDATGITNAGLVAGTYHDASGNLHGYTFDGTTYTTIDFPGSGADYAIGIGNAGLVLGTYALQTDGPWHAFVFDQGKFTSFDYPGKETDARGMNAAGQIVGTFNSGGATAPSSFVKTGDNFTRIDFPGAWGTEAWGIDDAGVVTGNYYDGPGVGIHGFIYSAGKYVALDFPGASTTRLTRSNSLHQFIGWQQQGNSTFGFLVSGSSFRSVNYAGTDSTIVAGINDSGQLVGRYTGLGCPAGCGFVATPTSGIPPCDQQFTLGYAGSALSLNFKLMAATPTTWSTYLAVQNTLLPLWSVSIPAITPSVTLSVPIPGVPHLGVVFGASLLSTPSGGVVCADIASVDTGL